MSGITTAIGYPSQVWRADQLPPNMQDTRYFGLYKKALISPAIAPHITTTVPTPPSEARAQAVWWVNAAALALLVVLL